MPHEGAGATRQDLLELQQADIQAQRDRNESLGLFQTPQPIVVRPLSDFGTIGGQVGEAPEPGSFEDLLAQFEHARLEGQEATDAREQEVRDSFDASFADVEGLGQQEREDITGAFSRQRGVARNDLISSGLASSTVLPGVLGNLTRLETDAQGRLNERLQRERFGFNQTFRDFLVGIEDDVPTLADIAGLAQSFGQGQGAGAGLFNLSGGSRSFQDLGQSTAGQSAPSSLQRLAAERAQGFGGDIGNVNQLGQAILGHAQGLQSGGAQHVGGLTPGVSQPSGTANIVLQ